MTDTTFTPPSPFAMTHPRAILTSLPMIVMTAVILSGGKVPQGPLEMFAYALTFLFINALFFLMLKTGRTDRYRAALFILYAVTFSIAFIAHYIEARGSMTISESEILECRAPFCHIVIPMTLIPIALTRTVIFPGTMNGTYASIAGMMIIWIGASISLGRGFCGWGCFLGGWDDGFSRILKKPVIRRFPNRITYMPFAVLLAVALLSAASLSPVYCKWLCPYKAVTEYVAVTSATRLLQMVIFLSLFAGLVVVLPVLTRKRIQCGTFCPFGAFQSFTNRISPFGVTIDKGRCIGCKKCINICPTFSMKEVSLGKGKARMTCIKCGKCVDNCPKNALSFHIRGTAPDQNPTGQRVLFLYAGFLFLATMSGGNIQKALLVVTGLFLQGGRG